MGEIIEFGRKTGNQPADFRVLIDGRVVLQRPPQKNRLTGRSDRPDLLFFNVPKPAWTAFLPGKRPATQPRVGFFQTVRAV